MAYYCYKQLRDVLMRHGKLDEFGDPVDKEKHGEHLTTCYDGNIHAIAAEFIEEMASELDELKGEKNNDNGNH